MDCPLFEVGTPPPHNSDMAYGLDTGTTHTYKQQDLNLIINLSLNIFLDIWHPPPYVFKKLMATLDQ